MGQKHSGSSTPAFLTSDYMFLTQMQHPAFGDIKIYSSPTSGDYIALKTITKDSKSYDQSLLSKLNLYQSTISQFIIRLHSFEIQEHKEYCTSTNQISLLFDYFPKTLKNEIFTRKQENVIFQETELIHIFLTILSALEGLCSLNLPYSDLTPDNILLSRSGICQLTPIDDIIALTAYQKLLYGSKKGFYTSPEVLMALKQKIKDFEENVEKCNIFSLAIILLEAMSFEKIETFYDLNEFRVKFENIEKFLSECSFNENFKFLLRKMLEIEPIKRPSYGELLTELNDYRENFLGIKLHCYSVKDSLDIKTEELLIKNKPKTPQNKQIIEFNDGDNDKKEIIFNQNQGISDNIGFSSYLGNEILSEKKKNNINSPFFNMQEIVNNGNNYENNDANENMKENIDINYFRTQVDKMFNESITISEDIQKKYQMLTNKKAIFPEDYEADFMQSSIFLNHRRNSPNNNNINESPTPHNSIIKNNESSTSLSKDYRFFTKNNNNAAINLSMSPFQRKSFEKIELKKQFVQNIIKNFDYNINSSPMKEKSEKAKLKSFNSTPKKSIKINKNDKKYYTPKRDPTEKMKMNNTGSTGQKKASVFKERPITPSYETLYWEALKKKF